MDRRLRAALTVCAALCITFAGSAAASRADGGPAPYATWVQGATAQHGLFTIWHKDGRVYLELTASQLDRDFIQTIVPGSGLGGNFVVWGNTDHLPTELVRFTRAGNQVAILWPNPNFIAPGSNAANALEASFPHSIVGLASIVAEDATAGTLVMDAAPFVGDMLDLADVLKGNLGTTPGNSYRLDVGKSYIGVTKSFPRNIVIDAQQDWTNDDPSVVDTAPDPRNIQMRVVYNIAEPPGDDGYTPRLADDRVGIYDDVYLDFSNDSVRQRQLRYIVRWNLRPSDPSKAVSPAAHPMVFTLSDTIPVQYRDPIRRAILEWNNALLKVGISDAIQVVDQPNDPNWDADDIRYNVIRWVTEARPSFGADSQTLYDPRTGEEFRTGVLVSADSGRFAHMVWRWEVDPVRYGRTTDPMPQKFVDDAIFSTLLHETGHNMGMQHNFIGSMAYTAKQLQDPAFTAKYGIASTAMEYAPMNIWPRPLGQGDYFQTTLGPYDYFAMQYAYAPITGAKTPQEEWPTLERWAAKWSDPRYTYASDEDVSWFNGHAADPRVQQGDLTNDPLGWCAVQMDMRRGLIASLNAREPLAGGEYEEETEAFGYLLGDAFECTIVPARYVGGQYLSRAHRGDPGAQAPIVPVPLAQERRAFSMLDKYLFSDKAWTFAPDLLDKLTYTEWSGYGYVQLPGYGNLPAWAYDPPQRHYQSVASIVGRLQANAIGQLFNPWVLQRLEDNPTMAAPGETMSIADLFSWMRASVYGDIDTPRSSLLRRNLQDVYERMLVGLVRKPAADAPADAQALARAELLWLSDAAASASKNVSLDSITRAHLGQLKASADAALAARD